MMPALELDLIAKYSALRLIDSLAGGLIVCAFTALLLRLSRRQNAGTRFAIGFSALLAIAVIPLTLGIFAHSHVSSATPGFVMPESWAIYAFASWAVIAGWFLVGVAKSIWHLLKLRNSCTPLDPTSLDPVLQETLRNKRTPRRVSLCTSELVSVPTAVGLVNSAIVIPPWVMQELSAEELNQVILHELSHLRRWDDWTNLAQKVVKAVFFFHPAVWWIEKKIAIEREMACDDAVLAETANPRAYAECIAHLAERTFIRRTLALAQAVVGRISETSQRVAQILNVNRPKQNAGNWKPAMSLILGVGVLCSVWASETHPLITFQNESSHAELASSSPIGAPVTKAAFVERASTQHAKPMLMKAKRTPRSRHANFTARESQVVVRSENSTRSLVHLTGFRIADTPVSETVFLVIETGSADSSVQQVYQIRMWQLVVPVVEPDSNKLPSKKT